MPTRSALAAALVAVALAAGGALAAAPTTPGDLARARAELAAAGKTRVLVAEKLTAREADLATRVRALYKLTRAGTAPLWAEAEARADLVRRRAAARRLLLRDLEERALLRAELDRAAAQEARAARELVAIELGEAPEPVRGRLRAPVGGRVAQAYGATRAPGTRLRQLARGVAWPTIAGAVVSAPAAGTVRWVGPLRGLGTSVLIEITGEEALTVLVTGLATVEPGLAAGQVVEAGTRLGLAPKGRIGLELRRHGRTIDPAPFL